MLENIVTIDASIAAGKSTVMQEIKKLLLKEHMNERGWPLDLDLEPVEMWEPYLERAYRYQNGWFPLQMRVIRDRMWPYSDTWVERSLFFQERVFVHPAVQDGRISKAEEEIISDFYSLAANRWKPTVYVYLRSTPEGCYQRMQKRGRPSENTVSLEYLQLIHDRHEAALLELKKSRHEGPLVIIEVEGKTPNEIAREILEAVRPHLRISA